jgi:outer membrane immunogenic protein
MRRRIKIELTLMALLGISLGLCVSLSPRTVSFFHNRNLMETAAVSGRVTQSATATPVAGYLESAAANGSQSVAVPGVGDEPGKGTEGPASGGGTSTTGSIGLLNTTTLVTASSTEITAGGRVTFTATVIPAEATGTVSFFDNGDLIGTTKITGGAAQLTTATLAAATQSILAAYSGGASYARSQSLAVLEVVNEAGNGGTGPGGPTGGGGAGTTGNNGLPNTTTIVTTSAAEITAGGSLTFMAEVTPATASGTVSFFDNGNLLGTATVVGGTARLAITTLAAATQSILAAYSGSASDNGSQSVPVLEVVDEAGNGWTGPGGPTGGGRAGTTGNNGLLNTTTILTAPSAEITAGGRVTFTATVTPADATGTVSFFDNGNLIGTATITGGMAELTTATPVAATQSILAAYSGSASDNGSQSEPVLEVAKKVGNNRTGPGEPMDGGGAGTTANNGLANTTRLVSAPTAEVTAGGSVTSTAASPPVASTSAEVQDGPKVEVGGEYNYVRSNAPPGSCGCISMNGGDGWLSYNLTRTLAAVAQFSAQTASNIGGSRGLDLTLTSYLFGPRVNRRLTDHFVSFVQALFGVAHANGSLAPGSSGIAGSPRAFAMTVGVGVDMKITRNFFIRPAEVDYYLTLFNNGVNSHQNNLRLSSGVVFRF